MSSPSSNFVFAGRQNTKGEKKGEREGVVGGTDVYSISPAAVATERRKGGGGEKVRAVRTYQSDYDRKGRKEGTR